MALDETLLEAEGHMETAVNYFRDELPGVQHVQLLPGRLEVPRGAHGVVNGGRPRLPPGGQGRAVHEGPADGMLRAGVQRDLDAKLL